MDYRSKLNLVKVIGAEIIYVGKVLAIGLIEEYDKYEETRSCDLPWIFQSINYWIFDSIKMIDKKLDRPFGSIIYSGILIYESIDDTRRKPSAAHHL